MPDPAAAHPEGVGSVVRLSGFIDGRRGTRPRFSGRRAREAPCPGVASRSELTSPFDYIAVGNVNAAGLARTSMAKSVLDAGWSSFRHMLAYMGMRHGAIYEEVSEAYTTQTCHECASIAGLASSP